MPKGIKCQKACLSDHLNSEQQSECVQPAILNGKGHIIAHLQLSCAAICGGGRHAHTSLGSKHRNQDNILRGRCTG